MKIEVDALEIINYWYSDEHKALWFVATPEFDQEIKKKYENLWLSGLKGDLDAWQSSATGCLALVILFDQFPLNMFRGEAKSFSSESKAIEITLQAIHRGFDKEIEREKLSFLYIPLMHSEKLKDQILSVELFKQNKLTGNIRFAEHHRDIVKKFARFPHRNKILGRVSTALEIDYLNSKAAFRG